MAALGGLRAKAQDFKGLVKGCHVAAFGSLWQSYWKTHTFCATF